MEARPARFQVTIEVRSEVKEEKKKDAKDEKKKDAKDEKKKDAKDEKKKDAKEETKTEQWIYQFGDEVKDKGVYGKMSKSDLVYLVQPEVLKVLQEDFADLSVFHFAPAKVKATAAERLEKVESRTTTLNVERKDKSWVVKNNLGDFQLDPFKIEQLVSELANLRAEKFIGFKTGAKPEHGLGKETRNLEIEIFLDGEKMPLTLTIGQLLEKEKATPPRAAPCPAMSSSCRKTVSRPW